MIRGIDPLVSLPATDTARARRFYVDLLGLTPVLDVPERGFHIFRGEESNGPMIGIHRHDGPALPADAQGVWVWLSVSDLKPVLARLAAHGVYPLAPPSAMGPGMQVAFQDSEGNVVRLFELVKEVRREIDIAAPPEQVYASLLDDETVELWFSGLSGVRIDPIIGGAVRFEDAIFGHVIGRIVEMDTPHRLVFRFEHAWPHELRYELDRHGTTTHLKFRLTGFEAIRDREFGIPGLIEHIDTAMTALVALAKAGGVALATVETVKALRQRAR